MKLLDLLWRTVFCLTLSLPSQQGGEILYNGEDLNAFVPERTAAYVDQGDLAIPDMTASACSVC